MGLLMAIPLLNAEDMDAGLAVLREVAEERMVLGQFQGLFLYLEEYWFRVVGRQVLAVGDLEQRTNNAVESMYAQLQKRIGFAQRPNLWQFLSE